MRTGSAPCLLLAAAVSAPSCLAFTGPLPISSASSFPRVTNPRPTSECQGQNRRQRSSLSRASMSSVAMPGMEDDEEGGNPFVAVRPLTEGPVYIGIQAVFVIALAGLVDAGFSGDWQARGYLSDPAAELARSACFATAVAHIVLTGASAFLANAKGAGIASAAVTLATGPLGFLKVAALPDQDELEAIAAAKAPALSMVINTMELASRQTPAAVVLSTSIKARKRREGAMRKLLEALVEETIKNHKDLVFTCTVNQDPDDRTAFFMLQRFPSPEAMSRYQNTDAFRAFTDGAEVCVAEPMGLYLVNERSGKLGEPVHPFGPGGEGGRDDAVYSSPVNLQGSLTGF